MKKLCDFTKEEIAAFRDEARRRYDEICSRSLKIDMSRGKPSPQQLDMAQEVFDGACKITNYKSKSGFDCRNYGLLTGIDEAKELFAELLGVDVKNVIVGGNASLELMFSFISQCVTKGIGGCEPWCRQDGVKFIAVVPGYDRHFGIAEYFGIEMVNVPINENGPDMDMVEELVKDPAVKGMFCVPKYSNPDGYTYSAETVERLAKMKPAAKDFRVIWDNAYIIHDLYDESDELLNIFDEAKKYGTEDNFIEFCSTSKITFPGAGISALAASDNNIKEITARLSMQIISYDKMNQLRHAAVFPDVQSLKNIMKKHGDILRPKFEAVLDTLERELGGLGIASWHKPMGGYFISLNVETGSAKYVGELCKNAGLTLTGVGATFPYKNDPEDKNIRIAPSYPSVDELKTSAELLCIAVKLAAAKAVSES
ncbi:MAG: aminotransferase class I/II-fold pyridoxal phosphate-dependent enzyme [Clostridiales bacterium]|nr:aminotransferase class I/II-fold pyridoxal phosphate-dependent enzyme [Clostridiales bacterium]